MFKTKSELDYEFYIKFYTKHKRMRRILFLMLKMILLSFISLPLTVSISKNNFLIIWMIFNIYLILLSVVYFKRINKKYAKATLQLSTEYINKNKISYITYLDDNAIFFENLDTHASGCFSYDKVISIYEIDEFYFLVFKSQRGLPINKSQFSEKTRIDCVAFLKSKCPKAKWK